MSKFICLLAFLIIAQVFTSKLASRVKDSYKPSSYNSYGSGNLYGKGWNRGHWNKNSYGIGYGKNRHYNSYGNHWNIGYGKNSYNKSYGVGHSKYGYRKGYRSYGYGKVYRKGYGKSYGKGYRRYGHRKGYGKAYGRHYGYRSYGHY